MDDIIPAESIEDSENVQISDGILDLDTYEEMEQNTEILFHEVIINLPKRIPCYAHILHNCIVKGLKSMVEKPAFKILAKVIGQFKRSQECLRELKDLSGLTLLVHTPTRWGSFFDMMIRFLKLEQDMARVIANRKKDWILPEQNDIEAMKEIVSILQPFREILEEVQSEKTVSICGVYTNTKVLRAILSEHKKHKIQPEIATIVNDLSFEVDKRMRIIYDHHHEKFDPIFLVASSLSPQNSKFLSEAEIGSASAYIKTMIGTISQQTDDAERQQPSSSQKLVDEFRNKMAADFERSRHISGTNLQEIIIEALKFIRNYRYNENESPIEIWQKIIKKEWEGIKQLALKIFCCPATGAPIERVFSIAGLNTARHRNRTKIDLLNDKMMIYINDYLKKV